MAKTDTVSKEQFDQVIDDILQESKYQDLVNENSLRQQVRAWLEYAMDQLEEWIKSITRTRMDTPKTDVLSKEVPHVFLVIAAIIAAAIISIIIFNVVKLFRRKGQIKEILGVEISEETTPNSLKDRASEFEEKEDYRSAVRYYYIALLLLMHDSKMIFLEETKTNDEIYSYLKREKYPFVLSFKEVVNVFNAIWYGKKSFNSEAYSSYKNRMQQLWSEVIDYEKEK